MTDKKKTLVANEESDIENDDLELNLDTDDLEDVSGGGKSKPNYGGYGMPKGGSAVGLGLAVASQMERYYS